MNALALTLALAAPQQAPSDGGWQVVDEVVVGVNEDIITRRQLLARIEQTIKRRGIAVSTQAEADRLRDTIARGLIRDLLSAQAGQELGVDPALVQQQIDDFIDRRIEQAGGVREMSEEMRRHGYATATQTRDQVRSELYGMTWDQAITGKAPGARGRALRDRYVRPGQLLFRYRALKDDPELVGAIGGRPPAVVLQELGLDYAALGGEERAQELARELVQRARAGEDFDALVTTYGAIQQDRGRSEPIPLHRLAALPPEVRAFAERAEAGAISEPLPKVVNGKPVGLAILRVVERTPLYVPDFSAYEVQHAVEQRALEELDGLRRSRAMQELFESSYVWPRPDEP
jgi:hypothetical protein